MAGLFAVQCPSCEKNLKLKSERAFGKPLKCPGCGESFVIEGVDDDDDDVADDEFDEDLDLFGVLDDEEEPGSGETDDDDNGEVSPPAEKRKKARNKKGSKKKSKKKKKAAASGGWKKPALIGGGVAVVAGLAAGLFMMFGQSEPERQSEPEVVAAEAPAKPAPKEPEGTNKLNLAYLPADAEMFVSVRVADLAASPLVQSWLKNELVQAGLGKMPDEIGLELADIDSVMIGVAGLTTAAQQLTQPIDPNAPPVDPAALPIDPAALPIDPAAVPIDATAVPLDPATQIDPNAPPVDPTAVPADPNAPPVDPAAPAAVSGAPPATPGAQPPPSTGFRPARPRKRTPFPGLADLQSAEFAAVVRLKEDFDIQDLLSKIGGNGIQPEEVEHNGGKYYRGPAGNSKQTPCLFVANAKTFVFGSEDVVKLAIDSKGKATRRKDLDFVDPDMHFLYAFAPSDVSALDKMLETALKNPLVARKTDQATNAIRKLAELAKGKFRGSVFGVKFTDGITLQSRANWSDAKAAAAVKIELDNVLRQLRENVAKSKDSAPASAAEMVELGAQFLNGLKASNDGTHLQVAVVIPKSTIDSVVEKFQQQASQLILASLMGGQSPFGAAGKPNLPPESLGQGLGGNPTGRPAVGNSNSLSPILQRPIQEVAFTDTPLDVAVQFVGQAVNVRFELDPALEQSTPITMSGTNLTLYDFLNKLRVSYRLTYRLEQDVPKITIRAMTAAESARPPTDVSKSGSDALKQQVSIAFVDTPLEDATAFLASQTKLRFQFAPGVETDTPVTAEVVNGSLKDVLDKMLTSKKLTYSINAQGTAITISAATAVAGTPLTPPDESPAEAAVRKEIAKFAGSWKVVAAEASGRKSDSPVGRVLYFEDGMVDLNVKKGKDADPRFEYVIDPSKSPKSFDVVSNGGVILNGIYAFEGDRLKLCYARGRDSKKPAGFVTKTASEMLYTMERVKPAPAPGKQAPTPGKQAPK